ncbi:hypothetical protein ACWCSD_52830, partial [Nonomuraea sp. NPDC001684]
MTAARVLAAQRGDTMAMNDLLAELTPYLGRICGPIALDSGPDAVQEALIAIFRHLRDLPYLLKNELKYDVQLPEIKEQVAWEGFETGDVD